MSTPAAAHVPAGRVVARAAQLSKVHGSGDTRLVALEQVSAEFRRGEFIAVLDSLTDGSVQIDGVELGTLKDQQLTRLRRDRIGFIFQAFNLLPTLTAMENITLPLAIAGCNPPLPGGFRRTQHSPVHQDPVGLGRRCSRRAPLQGCLMNDQICGGRAPRVA
ncbi:hypothetical protein [Streptomyces sp. HD1123-B1]|uniref:hypothetical protein n=1 Tax=Streptomyces huangiella TaxID=3228804 RepID=UPI003D7D189D